MFTTSTLPETGQIVFTRIPGFRPHPAIVIDVDRYTNEALVVTCTSKSRFANGRARELIDNWADHHLDLPTYLYTDRLRRYPTRDINHCVSWVDLGVIEKLRRVLDQTVKALRVWEGFGSPTLFQAITAANQAVEG